MMYIQNRVKIINSKCTSKPFLIFVADDMDNVRVKNYVRCKIFKIEL